MQQHSFGPYLRDSVVESAVALVLVKADAKTNAMTVSLFSEVAHHPTALWVAINPTTYTHSLIEEVGRFSISPLTHKQKEIAYQCGSISGREHDKCSRLSLYESPQGFLFLNRALASTGCTVRDRQRIGDHTLFIADIIEAEVDSQTSHLRHLLLSDL